VASAAQDTQDTPGPGRPYAVGDRDERPWGTWEVLAVGLTYVVKRITVRPQQRLSLQVHQNRDEHWTFVAGRGGRALVRGRWLDALVGSTFVVRAGEAHRIVAGDETLVLIEVQTGDCSEDDITRLEDDYSRA
jgi:mannose-6-phosphate isomerase-like protein (cupin superfamily)